MTPSDPPPPYNEENPAAAAGSAMHNRSVPDRYVLSRKMYYFFHSNVISILQKSRRSPVGGLKFSTVVLSWWVELVLICKEMIIE